MRTPRNDVQRLVSIEVERVLRPYRDVLDRLTSLVRGGTGRRTGQVLGRAGARRAARGENERACAVQGCGRESVSKGYCANHYQKLRNLIRTDRRPAAWKDFAKPGSVEDLVLPRGRAGANALRGQRRK